jgi:hypothetical protein
MTTSHTVTKKAAVAHTATKQPAVQPAAEEPNLATKAIYKVPPETMNIPSPPAGFEPTNGDDYRGVMPKKSELVVLEDAVTELKNSKDFSAIFGRTLPSVAIIIGLLDGGAQWSSTRAKASAFDAYCRAQEGLVWIDIRSLITKIKPVFEQAVIADSSLAGEFPSLGRFLAAQSAIAQRAVATRKANKEAQAKGEPVTRGKAAKAKTRAAEKAALAAQNAAKAASAANAAVAPPEATSPPAVVSASAPPVVTSVAAQVATNGAGTGATAGTASGATNGVAHS